MSHCRQLKPHFNEIRAGGEVRVLPRAESVLGKGGGGGAGGGGALWGRSQCGEMRPLPEESKPDCDEMSQCWDLKKIGLGHGNLWSWVGMHVEKNTLP
jgi:hypothetical protein